MTIHQDWLDLIFEQRTDVWIAERSGIPRATIGFVRRGERNLPAQYRTVLRSAYQSETVRRLDEVGMPHKESIRMSMVRPEGQREIYSRMSNIVNDFALGSTTRAFERSGEDAETFDWAGVFGDYVDKTKAGIRRSPRQWHDIREGFVS